MSVKFFPSCKHRLDFPIESARLAEYIVGRTGATVSGCCREKLKSVGGRPENQDEIRGSEINITDCAPGPLGLTAGDTAIVVCPTCAAIFSESGGGCDIKFVWEIIDDDPLFPFPDYHGKSLTLQDCWVCREREAVQAAVRSCLKKMNINVFEMDENGANTLFCGENMLREPPAEIAGLAPNRYLGENLKFFHPMAPSDRENALKAHVERARTADFACYCRFCANGIKTGGGNAYHLLTLLFAPEMIKNE